MPLLLADVATTRELVQQQPRKGELHVEDALYGQACGEQSHDDRSQRPVVGSHPQLS